MLLLQRYLEQEDGYQLLKDYVQELLNELESRFGAVDDDLLATTAAVLDPRVKLAWCKWSKNKNKKTGVEGSVIELMSDIGKGDGVPSKQSQKVSSILPDYLDFMQCDVSAVPEASATTCSILETAEVEFQKYIADQDVSDNPYDYWNRNAVRFPRLYKLSRRILIAPASTASVERVFSKASVILGPRRLSTADERFESELFGHLNKELFMMASVSVKEFSE